MHPQLKRAEKVWWMWTPVLWNFHRSYTYMVVMFQFSWQSSLICQVSYRSDKLFQNTTVWKLGTKICHQTSDKSALATLVSLSGCCIYFPFPVTHITCRVHTHWPYSITATCIYKYMYLNLWSKVHIEYNGDCRDWALTTKYTTATSKRSQEDYKEKLHPNIWTGLLLIK
jgi:hypothetical protein